VTPPVDVSGTTLTFRLTVEDNEGLQATDDVSVTIDDNGITGFPSDVLPMRTPAGESFGTKVVSGGNLINIEVIDPSTVSNTLGMPENLDFGLIDFQLKVDTPGATATVTVYFSQPIPEGYRWYKYTTDNGWIDFSASTLFNPARDQITLTLTDGGTGDDDGLPNGVIVDPSGLGTALSFPTPTIGGNDWGTAGGCFIQTVSPLSQIESLQQMPDSFPVRARLTKAMDKVFVSLFALMSPFLVFFINRTRSKRLKDNGNRSH